MRKKLAKRKATGRKTTKRKTVRKRSNVPESYKPTLLIDTKKLTGNSFKVGKKAEVLVSGTIVEESLRDWEAKGRKSYKLEISKITAKKK